MLGGGEQLTCCVLRDIKPVYPPRLNRTLKPNRRESIECNVEPEADHIKARYNKNHRRNRNLQRHNSNFEGLLPAYRRGHLSPWQESVDAVSNPTVRFGTVDGSLAAIVVCFLKEDEHHHDSEARQSNRPPILHRPVRMGSNETRKRGAS